MFDDEEQKNPDHESDPAHTPGYGWGEEGGASHLGPATHLESGRPEDEEDEADDSDENEG